jgi:hypothetical protein
LLQGGKLDDAFKSALVGGATGALTAGFAGESTFAQNVMADVGTGTSNIKAAFTAGSFEPLTSTAGAPANVRDLFKSETDPIQTTDGITKANLTKTIEGEPAFIDMGPKGDVFLDKNMQPIVKGAPKTNMFDSLKDFGKDFGSKTSDFLFGKDATQAEIFAKAGELQKNAAAEGLTLSSKQAVEMAKKELAPSFLRRYGPTAGLAGLGLYAAGAFDAPEQERLDIPESGLDIYNRSPETYNVAGMTPNLATGPFRIPTNYTFNYTPYRLPTDPFKKGDPPVFIPPFQRAAEGGEIFPRRNGGIGPNEGTPGKDSVRAMLMPGEFVMTTDAVKGLGNGDLNTGIKNMYSVMSKLEKKGKAMA